MSPVSVQVVIINNVTRRMTRSVYGRATWRSVGHLTTYGPIDNPTSVTPFFLLWREEKRRTRINQEPEPTILQLQYHLEVIPTVRILRQRTRSIVVILYIFILKDLST